MKIFFDTKFAGLHKDATLISIGLISEDRRQFYAELTDYDLEQCSDWVFDNILKHLYSWDLDTVNNAEYIPNFHIGNKQDISIALINWFKQFDYVELVSDACHYDFVLFIDLFGTVFDLPKNVCPTCYDINQDIAKKYNISQQEALYKSRETIIDKKKIIKEYKGNALYDAKIIRELYQILNSFNFIE